MGMLTYTDSEGHLLLNNSPMTRGDACTLLLKRVHEYEKTKLEPSEVAQIQSKITNGKLVEVVRCKYCKHYIKRIIFCNFWFQDRQENDFCSDGALEEELLK